jgi:hypothetical protein
MCLFGDMKNACNDNEKLSFITLSAATKNVTRYLRLDEKADEQSGGKSDADRTQEQKDKAQSDYVLHRVRDIAAFERRVSGKKD